MVGRYVKNIHYLCLCRTVTVRQRLNYVLIHPIGETIMNEILYPIGVQNFESLRKDGYLYVDKTAMIHRLVSTGRYYFFSRPRRFGKSLLLSTLEAYFQGKRELFDGLAMAELEKDWAVYPVLHLDLNIGKYNTPEELDAILNEALLQWEAVYGVGEGETTLALRFNGIIRRAHRQTGQRAVVLVDEYDKPMLQSIGNPELQKAYRLTLKSFYGVLKSRDGDIKFALFTGVTKFSKVSIFSDLNNLNDISRDNDFVSLCGITHDELHRYFEPGIRALAEMQKMTYEAACAKLKEDYDGYHFEWDTEGIYNPFSLLNTFFKKKFGSYWFETGTPTYLVELLQAYHYDLHHLEAEQTTAEVLDSVYNDDSDENDPIPVLYQSGYLTIRDYDARFDTYTLGFPNREVEEGFVRFLTPYYTGKTKREGEFEIKKFVHEVEVGEPEAFLCRLRSFMAGTPYELIRDLELHYQNVLFIVFRLMGFYTQVEYHTSRGRVDLVLQTDDYVYVMEFKLDGTAEEAIRQIDERQYAAPFATDSRRVFRIGVNFSSEERNIERWIIESGSKVN